VPPRAPTPDSDVGLIEIEDVREDGQAPLDRRLARTRDQPG
jgi:hypothetical protein